MGRASASDWIEAETVSHFAVAGRVAQAGAGSLLLSVSGAELFLGVWSAGFWARTAVVVLAVAGVTVLACGLAPLASRAKAPFPIDE